MYTGVANSGLSPLTMLNTVRKKEKEREKKKNHVSSVMYNWKNDF